MFIKPANRVLQISIFTNEDEYIHRIANIDQIWDNTILANIIWEKVEKVYKVTREECIATWNDLLYNLSLKLCIESVEYVFRWNTSRLNKTFRK